MVSSRLGQDSRRRAHHLHRMFSEMRDAQFTYLNASKSGNSVCHQAEQDVVGKWATAVAEGAMVITFLSAGQKRLCEFSFLVVMESVCQSVYADIVKKALKCWKKKKWGRISEPS